MPIDDAFYRNLKPIGEHQGHVVRGPGKQGAAAVDERVKAAYSQSGQTIQPLGVHGTAVAVDWDDCIADGGCLPVCPVAVFEWIQNPGKTGKDDRASYSDKSDPVREPDCIFCMACVTVCPVTAIRVDQSLASSSKPQPAVGQVPEQPNPTAASTERASPPPNPAPAQQPSPEPAPQPIAAAPQAPPQPQPGLPTPPPAQAQQPVPAPPTPAQRPAQIASAVGVPAPRPSVAAAAPSSQELAQAFAKAIAPALAEAMAQQQLLLPRATASSPENPQKQLAEANSARKPAAAPSPNGQSPQQTAPKDDEQPATARSPAKNPKKKKSENLVPGTF